MNQVLLSWLTRSYVYYRASEEQRSAFGLSKPQGIGYGIGLAFAVFVMQGENHTHTCITSKNKHDLCYDRVFQLGMCPAVLHSR